MLDRPAHSLPGRLGGLDDIGHGDFRLRAAPDLATAQEVDALIVRDAKQPRTDWPPVVERVELAVGLEQRILHHVLTIEAGAGHPGAVSVQLWAQITDGLE